MLCLYLKYKVRASLRFLYGAPPSWASFSASRSPPHVTLWPFSPLSIHLLRIFSQNSSDDSLLLAKLSIVTFSMPKRMPSFLQLFWISWMKRYDFCWPLVSVYLMSWSNAISGVSSNHTGPRPAVKNWWTWVDILQWFLPTYTQNN